MTRAVVFDVDGVLVHGYHARPELQRRWDENLLEDLGIDPDRFREEFIYDIFLKKVLIGQTSLVEALDRRLPSLGFKGSSMMFVHYWLSHDSSINQSLMESILLLKKQADIRLFIATNQDHMRALWLWQSLNIREIFEDIFYSARAGVLKPHKAFFNFIEDRIGPQSEPPLFFDDTPKVIAGAQTVGWEAVLFNGLEDFTGHRWVAQRLAAVPQ